MAVSPVVMAAAPLILLLLASLAGAVVEPAEEIGVPNCNITCGDMKVPYPFGMGLPSCYWPGFKLTCNSTGKTPQLLLGTGTGTLQVEDLYLQIPYLRVRRTGSIKIDAADKGALGGGFDGVPYMLGTGINELTLTGCNVRATLKKGNIIMASCSSMCSTPTHGARTPEILMRDSLPCSGSRCCQADVISRQNQVDVTSYDVEVTYLGSNRSTDEAQVPTRVFVSKKGWFEQVWLATDHPGQPNRTPSEDAIMPVPIWLQWGVSGDGIQPVDPNSVVLECPREAVRRVCKSKNSTCSKGAAAYTCRCDDDFEGNPYVTDGCKERCYYGDTATCVCPLGTQGDPYRFGGCTGLVTGLVRENMEAAADQEELSEVVAGSCLEWGEKRWTQITIKTRPKAKKQCQYSSQFRQSGGLYYICRQDYIANSAYYKSHHLTDGHDYMCT